MNDFKIGDKFKLKKLSEKEFKEIYRKNKWNYNYIDYLNFYDYYFNKVYKITKIDNHRIFCKNCISWFYKEEVEKVSYLKTKYKIVNKILNKK